MDDETQKRVSTILSSGIAYALAGRPADKLIKEPDVKEGAVISRRRF